MPARPLTYDELLEQAHLLRSLRDLAEAERDQLRARVAELELDHARLADLAETMAGEWRRYRNIEYCMPLPEFVDALSELITATGVELDLSEPARDPTTKELR